MSKKLIAIALAVTFVFSFTAKAVTVEELQAQVQQLLALIAQLQSQLQSQQTVGMVCFNTDLKLGMTSNDVKNLQIKLGVTPASGYFGPKTLAAVKAFQKTNGIIATGYVGPLTRLALNSQYCVPPTTTTTVAPESTTTTTTVAPSYGSLSVTSYPVSNPASTFYAGGTYELFAAQFKATGSDITVKKVGFDLNVSPAGGNIFPWQVFSTISLWDGATKLSEVAVTQANVIEDTFASHYWLNISGFGWVIPNGQTKVLTVKATLLPTIPSAVGTTKGYTVTMNSGIVYSDTAGVTYSTISGLPSLTKTVSNIQASNTANLTASLASDNPLEGNVVASTGASSKVDVLKFNVKNDSDVNATLNSGSALVTVSNATATSYITAVELWDGSTLVASAGPTNWVNASSSVSWTNFTLPIAANTTKTLTVKAVIAQIPTTDTTFVPGSSVKVSNISFTGIDSNSNVVPTDLSTFIALSGNEQYIYVKAPSFAFTSGNATVTGSNPQNGHPNDIVDATIAFTVTANNSDIFIPTKDTLSNALTGTGVTATGTPSTTWTCNSPADNTSYSGYWRIPSGNTATCTFSYHAVNTGGPVGYNQLALQKVTWNTTNATSSAVAQNYGFESTYKTNTFYLGN